MLKLASLAFVVSCTVLGVAQNGAVWDSQAARPQVAQVSATALMGMVEHKSLPQYPKAAMLKGIQGDVVFKVAVDENGKITHSDVARGDPLLVAASQAALKDYRFHPYLVDGTPTAFASEVGYHFGLSRKGDAADGTVECMTSIP
jgi:periplasmic protein TonB